MQRPTEPTAATAPPQRPTPRGDEGELYRRHHRDLHRTVARAVNGSRELIEDACQTAWLILLRRQPDRERVFYTEGPNVDITPAFPVTGIFGTPDGYYIPRGDGRWQQTNPYVHDSLMVTRNQELGGYLKPLVRLLKRWNRVHSKRLGSFHLELVAQASFRTLGGNTREAVAVFFEYAGQHLHVSDPAGYSGDMAATLSWTQEEAILQSFTAGQAHARCAIDAEAAGDVAEALRQWRIVFGNEFPAYTG